MSVLEITRSASIAAYMGGGTGCLPREGIFYPGFKTVYMGGGTGCSPGRDAFHPGFTYIYIYLEIIFGIYTRCQFFSIKVGRVNSSIRKIYILRPNRD